MTENYRPLLHEYSAADDEEAVKLWLERDAQPNSGLLQPLRAWVYQVRYAQRAKVDLKRHFLASAVNSVGIVAAGYMTQLEVIHAWAVVVSIFLFRLLDLFLQIWPNLKRSTHYSDVEEAMMRATELLRETAPITHADDAKQKIRNNNGITALLSLIEAHVRHLVNVPPR